MKNVKETAFEKNVWQQVAVKIKNADVDRRNETQDLMNKIKATIERNETVKCIVRK